MSHVTKEIARELTKTHSNFHTRETWGETQRNKSEGARGGANGSWDRNANGSVPLLLRVTPVFPLNGAQPDVPLSTPHRS
jgi:hypothetical protein